MGRYMGYRKTGIDVKSGGDINVESGATLTVAGTFTYSSGTFAPTTVDASGAVRCESTLEVNGIASFGTHSAAQTTISAAGVYASSAALSCGVATVTSLVIGAGAGTIADAADILTLTETNISLVGIVGVTGATTITGAVSLVGNTGVTGTLNVTSTLTVATNKLSVNASTGAITLANSAVIDASVTDLVGIGAKVYICNDTSPSAVPTNACVIWFDGTDLKARTAAGTATLNDASFA